MDAYRRKTNKTKKKKGGKEKPFQSNVEYIGRKLIQVNKCLKKNKQESE